MISELLQVLERNQGELDLTQLGRQMQSQPSAVAGMIEMLVRKGRLIEVASTCGVCETCGIENQCAGSATMGKRYVVARRRSLAAPKS
jgi:Mn-dependent DtxR family transcriptional regulator